MCFKIWFAKLFYKENKHEIIHTTHDQTKDGLNMMFTNPLYNGPRKKSQYGNYYHDYNNSNEANDTYVDIYNDNTYLKIDDIKH